MKKTIYTVIATLLFLISSCTLEQEVYNKINPGMFPQNAEDVNALVNSSAYYVFSPWGIFGLPYIIRMKLMTGISTEIIAACMTIPNIWLP